MPGLVDANFTAVTALGINVTGISLPTKKVVLKGFNDLKAGVTIQAFNLPSNDPAGGITLTLETTVANVRANYLISCYCCLLFVPQPSQVGIALSTIGFNAFYGTTELGPVASTAAITLLPNSTSPLALVGRLIPQNTAEGLAAVSAVFNNFIHGESSNVSVVGTAAGPSNVSHQPFPEMVC